MSHANEIRIVGIMSPGDMGHAIGRELRNHGMDVVACLQGRSDRTKGLSKKAGLREIESWERLVTEADVVLSILVPSEAESTANKVASAMRSTAASVHYVDCNAVSPQTICAISDTIVKQGGIFTDGSIIGFPPGTAEPPRLYVSGPQAKDMQCLDGKGVEVKSIGSEIGQASGIKMCYAALTKGSFALYYALAITAERLGLLDGLLSEFKASQADEFQRMQQHLPRLPAKAGRWIGEMEQIAATFEQTGVTPHFHNGAAEIYRLISESPLGNETPEMIDASRTLSDTIAAISGAI